MNKIDRWVLIAACVLFVACFSVAQTTIYVDALNPNCPGSGTLADPFCTIQDGMNLAAAGDTVLVTDGIYSGPGNLWLWFPGGWGFTVRSQGGPENCIIDLQGSGPAFFLVGDEPPTARIEGFMIRNGNTSPGGAVFNHHMGSATFVNCIFLQNNSGAGGAVYCDDDGSPTFIGCSFFGNTAVSGGAFYSQTTSPGIPTLINCVFGSNTASSDGGALFVDGISTIRVVNCTLSNNVATGNGSGIFSGAFVNTTVTNCILWGNVGSELAGPATVTFSNVQGGFAGQGNIAANPLFLNPLNTDLRLNCGSPCLDAGTNAPGVSLPALDHEGRDQRVIGIVDMGADEIGAFWSFNGPEVIGGAPVSFTATAAPAQNGNLAFLGVSSGNGRAPDADTAANT